MRKHKGAFVVETIVILLAVSVFVGYRVYKSTNEKRPVKSLTVNSRDISLVFTPVNAVFPFIPIFESAIFPLMEYSLIVENLIIEGLSRGKAFIMYSLDSRFPEVIF